MSDLDVINSLPPMTTRRAVEVVRWSGALTGNQSVFGELMTSIVIENIDLSLEEPVTQSFDECAGVRCASCTQEKLGEDKGIGFFRSINAAELHDLHASHIVSRRAQNVPA